jgi:hypothetical protein
MDTVPTTDQGKRAWLEHGTPLVFDAPPADREETPEEKAARTIQAAWLEELASKPARTVRVPVEIAHAIIEGPLDLQHATFEFDLSITHSRFTGEVNSSFATFKRRACFDRCSFSEAANFRAAHAHADFELNDTQFADASGFMDLHVAEVLGANGATFGPVSFERIEVGKGAFFKQARFSGEARFLDAHIKGSARFEGAQFEGSGDAASFDGAQIDGGAFFRPATGADGKPLVTRFHGAARFLGVHIGGNAEFEGAQFDGKERAASFDGAQIDGSAFFRPPTGPDGKPLLDADGHPLVTRFQGEAAFPGARVGGQVSFDRAEFAGPALFHRAHFQAEAAFGGAQFKKRASFDGAQIDGGAFFGPATGPDGKPLRDADGNPLVTRFQGEARFHGVHIGGQADFTGAQFERKASFDRAQIDGGAFFRPATGPDGKLLVDANGNPLVTRFKGEARFVGVHIRGNAEFDAAQFEQKASFDGAQIDGDAFFRPARGPDDKLLPVRFKGAGRFLRAHIKGTASFTGAQFEGTKDAASFDGAQIDGSAFFRPATSPDGNPLVTRFKGEARFPVAVFGSQADFTKAEFARGANFENAHFRDAAMFREAAFSAEGVANFGGARFERGAFFQGAKFQGPAQFTAARADRDAYFQDAVFDGPANFREAHFHVVSFREETTESPPAGAEAQFHKDVDLRWFTYERIGVAWRELLGKLEQFTRHPYIQLESVLRAMGEEGDADRIYYERRLLESRRLREKCWQALRPPEGTWKRWASYNRVIGATCPCLGDAIEHFLLGYGVRVGRLWCMTVLVLLVGVLVFHLPAAVTAAKTGLPPPDPLGLDWMQALGVSLNQFLPVTIPSGSNWAPTGKPIPVCGARWISFSAYASFHRLMGWLLVFCLIFRYTGLRYRLGYRPAPPWRGGQD